MCEGKKFSANASSGDEEDWYVSEVAEERDTPDAKFVSHDEFWSEVNKT